MSVAVGAFWRRWRHVAQRDQRARALPVRAHRACAHACLTLTLPSPLSTLREIAVPVIVIYPLASVLLGLLMIDQRRRRHSESALRESEQRFAAFADHVPGRLWIRDSDLRYLSTSTLSWRATWAGTRPPRGQDAGGTLGPRDRGGQFRELCRRALDGEPVDLPERWPDQEGAGYFRSLLFAVTREDDEPPLGGLMFDDRAARGPEELSHHAERRLRRTVEGAVLAMSHVVETRDPYTAGHERRWPSCWWRSPSRGHRRYRAEGPRLAALIHADIWAQDRRAGRESSKPGRRLSVTSSAHHEHAHTDTTSSRPSSRPTRGADDPPAPRAPRYPATHEA